MALQLLFQEIDGTLTADVASTSVLLPIDLDTLTLLQASVNFAAGDWTYLRLSDGVVAEEVKVTDTTGGYLIVERGTSGSTPQAFAAINTVIRTAFGADAIRDVVAENPVPVAFTVAGTGLVETSRVGNDVTVHVDAPNILGEDGVQVMGSWPNVTIGLEPSVLGCCPGETAGGAGGTGGIANLSISSTILSGSITGDILNLALTKPVFTGMSGVTITGDWPNYTITGSGIAGGGTVTSVAVGAGLTLTGNPAVNPTIAITNTGVTAGIYGDIEFNARGQAVNIAVGFNPISTIAFAASAGVATRVGGTVTLTLAAADVASPGIVALADSTAPIDPLDDSSAVTPKMLSEAVGSSVGAVAGTYSSEADAAYTNTLTNTAIAVDLATGESAIIIGEVVVFDTATPTNNPIDYGVAVFNASSVKVWGSKKLKQSKQPILGKITGPYTGTISILTTALPAGAVVEGAALAVVNV